MQKEKLKERLAQEVEKEKEKEKEKEDEGGGASEDPEASPPNKGTTRHSKLRTSHEGVMLPFVPVSFKMRGRTNKRKKRKKKRV
jgi:hypothetical protein